MGARQNRKWTDAISKFFSSITSSTRTKYRLTTKPGMEKTNSSQISDHVAIQSSKKTSDDNLAITSGAAKQSTELCSSQYVKRTSALTEDTVCHPDPFVRALAGEGILLFIDPVYRSPVLTICHGFLNTELIALGMNTTEEQRYRASVSFLDQATQEKYSRLFGSQYPLEPVVDGLPESVWLQCVEPCLSVLKSLSSLKRRKSNLGLRRVTSNNVDCNSACRGDFELAPLLFQPAMHHTMLMRIRFLALEGARNMIRDNAEDDDEDRDDEEEDDEEDDEDEGQRRRENQIGPFRFRGARHLAHQRGHLMGRRHLHLLRSHPYEILQELLNEIRHVAPPPTIVNEP